MALQADGAEAGVRNHSAVRHLHRAQRADQVRVVGGHGQAMRFVASLAANGRKSHIGDRSDRIAPIGVRSRPGNEAISRVTGHAIDTGGARSQSVAGGIPLGAINVVGRSVMALITVARIDRLADEIGIAKPARWREDVLAAGTVAVFTLNVTEGGHIGVNRLHISPVGRGQHGRESPTILLGGVVKATIDRIGIDVVAGGVALEAGRAVTAQLAIDAFGEDVRMGGFDPRGVHVWCRYATTVTERAGVYTHVGGGRDGLRHVGRAVGGRHNGGDHRVLSLQVRTQQHATGYLSARAGIHVINGNIRSQRATGQGHQRACVIRHTPSDTDNVCGGNGAINIGLQIDRGAEADRR